MILTIPVSNSILFYNEIVQLEGIEYIFQFHWSTRESAWYIDIADQGGTPIASSIRLVVDWNLIKRFESLQLPPGVLMCCDMTGKNQDIEVATDLGTRVLLLYVTSDDPLVT